MHGPRATGATVRGWLLGCTIAGLHFLAGHGASADGMPSAGTTRLPAPVVNWGGLYAGGQLGGAWSAADWELVNANYFNTLGPVVVGNEFDHSPGGVIGGVVVGYNHQSGPWLLGLEVSLSAADLKEQSASPYFPASDTFTSEINWLASIAARAGYAWDRWLVYAKGGWAGADIELTLVDHPASIRAASDEWSNGWTVGIGLEYMLSGSLMLGLAYDYVKLDGGDDAVACANCGTGVGFGTPVVDGDIEVHSVMVRLSYLLSRY